MQEKRAALEAVLGSDTFARSEQLRAFLRFVCEMEAANRAAELTEYLIGVKALGRPENFSPLEDSSVRTRAYEVRQRLQKYYATEKPEARLRIELPKGSYVPRFALWSPPEGPGTEKPDRPATLAAAARSRFSHSPGWIVGFLAGVVLTAAVGLSLTGRNARPQVAPAVRRAWAPIAARDPEVLICMSTPLHLQVSPYIGAIPEGTPKYPAPEEMYSLFRRYRNLPKDTKLEIQPVQKSVTFGNVEGLVRVVGTLQSLGAQHRILPETNSPLTAMRQRSVVLFGSPWYSRAASSLLERTPWTMAPNEETNEIGLFGRGPQEGKKYIAKRSPRGEYQEVFGLITVLPNDEASEAGHTIVVFSGLTSAGTHGAAAFFTSATDLKNLWERFQREGLKTWPRSFQVVVRCRVSEDTQLLSYSFEVHQILIK